MALVTGPLLSLDARGKVAGALVFSNWKGRPVVRKLVTPSNPQSGAQTGQRAMLGFLSTAWAPLSAAKKATWDTLAATGNYSGFNAFTKYNLDEWTQFQTPYNEPELAAETPPTMGALTVTGGVRQLTVSQVITVAADIWGMVIAVSTTTGFTPAKSDVMKVVLYAASPIAVVLSGLAADTYYVRTSGFDHSGQQTAFVAEQSGIVT
jgi:hypothetical protein